MGVPDGWSPGSPISVGGPTGSGLQADSLAPTAACGNRAFMWKYRWQDGFHQPFGRGAMTEDPTPSSSRSLASHVNEDIIRDAPVVTDLSEWAVPGFFDSVEELRDFQRWVRAERDRDLA